MNSTEKLKSTGQYYSAGMDAFANKRGRYYGCHYGMRSDRQFAMNEFYLGYDEAEEDAREQYKERMLNHV